MRRVRIFSQILFLLLFLFLFILSRYPFDHKTGLEWMIRFSPLSLLFFLFSGHGIPLFLLAGLIILLSSIFIGRYFCGWVCPLGTTLDGFYRLFVPKKRRFSGNAGDVKWKRVKYIGLLAFAVMAAGGFSIWGMLDPLSIFTRITTLVFYPVFTEAMEFSLITAEKFSWLESPVMMLHDWYKQWIMPEEQFHTTELFLTLILIFGIFGGEFIRRRFWCRYICPAGAFLGILSSFRFYERMVKPSCTSCNLCQTNCKMGAIPVEEIGRTSKLECIECFNCGSKCPPKNSSIEFRWRWKPYFTSPDLTRRQFLATTGASALIFMGFNTLKRDPVHHATLLRPPGVEDEQDFMDKCIRCMACVRICASNGKCLQPTGLEYGIENLWTPIARMRLGYCEYNCNLCMEVCPTGAIPTMSLKDKQQFVMGMAYFDKDLCIPYAENRDCIVCEEHCPLPDKAIKFQEREALLPDGTRRMVKYPYVDYHLCIGCGICENKCPLQGKPGIFVIRKDVVRLQPTDSPYS